jgi:hypothetical protein
MANQYNIRILDGPGGTIVFWPWVPGSGPGTPLYAKPSDPVTWNNTTANTVTLVSNPKGTYITEPILSGKVSSPMFPVPTNGLVYTTADGKFTHSISTASPPPPPPPATV